MTAVDATAPVRTTSPAPRVTFTGVLRSELGKLTSLRSTRVAAVAVPVLLAGGMLLRAWAYSVSARSGAVGVPPELAWTDVLDLGTRAAELGAIVLAALAVGSEHAGRAGLSTYVAVPRRLLVLGAKAVAVLVPLAVLLVLGLVAGTAVSSSFMTSAGLGPSSALPVGTALADLGLVLACAVLVLAATTLLRSTAAGITVALVLLLVLPPLASIAGAALGLDLVPLLLTYAAPMALTLHDPDGSGALVRDVVVTLGWLVVPSTAAALALVRRDV